MISDDPLIISFSSAHCGTVEHKKCQVTHCLTCQMECFTYGIYFSCPSGKQPIHNVFKGEVPSEKTFEVFG